MPRKIPTHKPRLSKAGAEALTEQSNARRLRSKAAWTKCSRLGRQMEPLCCDPFGEHGERVEQATDRHHIKRAASRPALFLKLSNHASLCKECHSKIETMERAGQRTEHLFAGAKRVHPLTKKACGYESAGRL